jgi:arylsulfatase A-like enzyme
MKMIIDRKVIYYFSISLSSLFFIALSLHTAFAQKNQPNIIIIFADDLGYGELGSYGQQLIQTPHLDKLASQGMRFTDFYSSSALCAPARCQLLTGLHSGHGDLRANFEMANGPASFTDDLEKGQLPLPDQAHTIAEMLKPLGYSTACIGKWGLGMADTDGNPNHQGFDYFYGYLDQKQAHNYYPTHLWENGKRVALNNKPLTVHTKISPDQATDETFHSFIGNDYSVALMAKKAATFIKDQQGKPFFLYYALTLPHLALQVPQEELDFYKGKFEETPYLGDKGYCPVKYPKSTYAAMITYLDKKVGEIIKQLEDSGQRENTLILFTSDNGAAFPVGGTDPEFFNSNGNLRELKGSLYEGGIRIPFIASWPDHINAGRVSNHVAAQYDIKATLADLLKITIPQTDGISFLPELLGKKQPKHEFLYFELFEYGGQQAVRMGDWKAVKRNMVKDKNAQWELYNLKSDIGENDNVAGKNPSLIKKIDNAAKQSHQHHNTVLQWNFME